MKKPEDFIFWALAAILAVGVALVGGRMLLIACTDGAAAAMSTSDRVVVLDAGHGGEDGGTSTTDGVPESGINLSVALKCEQLFALLGQETVMIRTTDTAIYTQGETLSAKKVSDIKNRVKIVDSTPGALLVSIHQNFFQQSKYSGAQVFYAPGAESKCLAERTQAALKVVCDPGNNRQVKKSPQTVYLMNHISSAGILIECGFLSNPDEAARLQTEDYQKKLALAISGSVAAGLSEEDTNEV